MIVFTFYDDRRAVIDEARVGPFDGTFDWRTRTDTVSVPLKARECIFRIGLLGRGRRTLARRSAAHRRFRVNAWRSVRSRQFPAATASLAGNVQPLLSRSQHASSCLAQPEEPVPPGQQLMRR